MIQALNEKPKKPKLILGDSGNLIRKSKTTAMPCLTDKNYETFSTLNQDDSRSNISRTKTRFDISFKTQSSKHVITSPSYALYPDKNYGSRLDEISGESALLYALCFARCAVYGMDGVYITNANAVKGGINFSVSINNEAKEVFVEFEHNL